MIRARIGPVSRPFRLYSTDIKLPSSGESNFNNNPSSSNSISLSKHPHAEAEAYAANEESKQQQNGLTTLIPPPHSTHPRPSAVFSRMHPPFHTHKFVTELEGYFPAPALIARTLMRATRAMLIHKVGLCRREGLDKKDMENVRCILRSFN